MRKIMTLVLFLLVLWPHLALAAPISGEFKWMHLADGAVCSEIWYNDALVWRVILLTDGARPVTGLYDSRTIFIAPDIRDGCFIIQIQ